MSRILIVDDSQYARRTLRERLEALGYVVDEASRGEEAIAKVRIARPDLIILDLVMPGMSGLATLERLRRMAADVPVLMASADVQASTAKLAKAGGAKGILNKPPEPDSVSAIVTKLLRGGDAWDS